MKGFACKLSPATFTHFCIAFTFIGLREDVVLNSIKSAEVFLQRAPRELHSRHDLVENSRDADINDISHIQWSKRIKNIQWWRYLEIWFWRSEHAEH